MVSYLWKLQLNIMWFLQETLDELANASGTEFEIPENFDDQVLVSTALTLDFNQHHMPQLSKKSFC